MGTRIANPKPKPIARNTLLEEIRRFEESRIGVKGLVDRGVTTIPSFFVRPNPPEPNLQHPNSTLVSDPEVRIPVIDLSFPRSMVVDQVRRAASSLGFFQIVNHPVPPSSTKKLLDAIQEFFELPESIKMEYYTRNLEKGVAYSTNYDLYHSKAGSWGDTLQIRLAPNLAERELVPPSCRKAVPEWDEEVVKVSEEMLDILCEALGLENGLNKLKEFSGYGRVMAAHYYPYCPQPELTAGLRSHTDPGLLTALVQNEVPGFQVKLGEKWVDVEPVGGAILIIIGDMLQIMSNGEYTSVEHKVLANPLREPRVSAAVCLKASLRDQLYGPFPELVSAEKPALFRRFTLSDYMERYLSKELDCKTLVNYYRV